MPEVKIHWKSGFIWLAILAPLFFILYGWANNYASNLPQEKVGEIVYDWEKHIPFIPWTILPYWSIDLLYGLSLFLPMTKLAQRQHALRLLVATPIAILFFYFFPLTFSTPRPESYGIWKTLFDALMGFDKPYNQAPSLHIILLVIIWQIYLPHFKKEGKLLWHIWCFLIGISVLTTFQHHFIDIPAGFLAGVLICYLFPLEKMHQWKWHDVKSKRLALKYCIGGSLLVILSFFSSFWPSMILLWIGLSLLIIGFGYLKLGAVVFQKNEEGTFTFSAKVLHFPYRIGMRSVRRLFFNTDGKHQKITDQIYLGAFSMSKKTDCVAIFDLCPEYQRSNKNAKFYQSYPLIDLASPTVEELSSGVQKLNKMIEDNHKVYIHCALGLSRSAIVVLAWLLFTEKAKNPQEAIAYLKNAEYHSHLSKKHQEVLEAYFKTLRQ
ncbi:MAG TPA: phosphatase PAP2/dual specificity phosphatase family protein [Flavobacterium sp.]|jgi:hypothetical protein